MTRSQSDEAERRTMRNVDKLLCPVDFSETSAYALRSAQELARHFRATLVVAHVLDGPAHSPSQPPGDHVSVLGSEYETAMKDKLHDLVATLDDDVPVETRIIRGSAADAIASLAERESCDLIVMGTHGRSGVRRMLLGSVTEHVLRVSNVPVLTMRAPRSR
jgi:nucleotide-binding universal stress UspA family protein